MQAPKATKHSHTHTLHGHQREDPYFWLNQRSDPNVIAYLESENAYTEKVLESSKALQDESDG